MALSQTHADAAKATTPGARAAVFIRGLASHIQAALNDPDNLAQVRELCVQASLMADDVALTVEHGGEEAERIREGVRRREALGGASAQVPVAPSVDTPRAPPSVHAAPTDYQRAPTRETTGTVPAQPTRGERASSAPNPDQPGPATATSKEQKAEPAGASHAAPKK